MYNEDTLKNSHLIEQMAHHRLSPVTHNMYEVFTEIDRISQTRLYTWCAGNRDPWYKFTKGGGSVGDN